MREGQQTPKWQRPPDGCRCIICGQTVRGRSRYHNYDGDDYEVVKPRGGCPTIFLHTACVEKERAGA